MLYKSTIEDSTLELMNKLMDDEVLKDFFLVGYEMKYNANPIIPIKAMVYFDDIYKEFLNMVR